MRGVVPPQKISVYLLDPNHPVGGAKARFFLAGGFSAADPDALTTALLRHFATHRPSDIFLDRLGCVRIVVSGPMAVPDGRTPIVISVWIVEGDENVARLITAYPAE